MDKRIEKTYAICDQSIVDDLSDAEAALSTDWSGGNDVERRGVRRRAINSLAWADPGGILPVIDCKILDLTEDGARIVAPYGVDMPEMFQLQIDSSRILGAAEVVWRGQHDVGVKFLTRL